LFGTGFAFVRRIVAILCVAQVLTLSAQAAVVVVDQAHHALGMNHAANALAGPVIEHFDGDAGHLRDHASHPANLNDESPPVGHHHAGDGTLTPWYGVAAFDLTRTRVATPSFPPAYSVPTVAFDKRFDRPPKSLLEQM